MRRRTERTSTDSTDGSSPGAARPRHPSGHRRVARRQGGTRCRSHAGPDGAAARSGSPSSPPPSGWSPAGAAGPRSAPPRAPGGGSSGKCGTFNLAVNNWVGYEANAAVIAYVAEKQLGCKVVKKNLDEQVSWQGFGTGEVDAVVENWGHEDLVKKYITEQKVAKDLGQTGNIGKIGWYVPPWLAKAHPDITDWNNLNKYAPMFKTSESGGKGQLLDGDPGVRHQRRRAGEEPQAELQGGVLRLGGGPDHRRSARPSRTRSR